MTDEDRLRIEKKAKEYATNNKQIPNDFYEADILCGRDFMRGAEYEHEALMFTIGNQLAEIIRLRTKLEHLETFDDLRYRNVTGY